MSLKKICFFIVMSSIAFSSEIFARHHKKASEDIKRTTLTKRRVIHAPRTTGKFTPQKAIAPSTNTRRTPAARKKVTVSRNERRDTLRRSLAARKRAAVSASTRRAALKRNMTTSPVSKKRGVNIVLREEAKQPLVKKKNIPSRKRSAIKKSTLPKEHVKKTPTKAPVIDENVALSNELMLSYNSLYRSFDELSIQVNESDRAMEKLKHTIEELRHATDALSKTNKQTADLLNVPGFKERFIQRVKERLNKLDPKKKEELRKLIQKPGKVPSNK